MSSDQAQDAALKFILSTLEEAAIISGLAAIKVSMPSNRYINAMIYNTVDMAIKSVGPSQEQITTFIIYNTMHAIATIKTKSSEDEVILSTMEQYLNEVLNLIKKDRSK